MADWADLHRGTSLGHACAYCKRPLRDPAKAEVGRTTGLLYCPDSQIMGCLRAFGENVEQIDYTWRAA